MNRRKSISHYADAAAQRDYRAHQKTGTVLRAPAFRKLVEQRAGKFAETHAYPGLTKRAVKSSYDHSYTWTWCQCEREAVEV